MVPTTAAAAAVAPTSTPAPTAPMVTTVAGGGAVPSHPTQARVWVALWGCVLLHSLLHWGQVAARHFLLVPVTQQTPTCLPPLHQ